MIMHSIIKLKDLKEINYQYSFCLKEMRSHVFHHILTESHVVISHFFMEMQELHNSKCVQKLLSPNTLQLKFAPHEVNFVSFMGEIINCG